MKYQVKMFYLTFKARKLHEKNADFIKHLIKLHKLIKFQAEQRSVIQGDKSGKIHFFRNIELMDITKYS